MAKRTRPISPKTHQQQQQQLSQGQSSLSLMGIPQDVWLAIARRLDLESSATVFALLLTNRSAYGATVAMLVEWFASRFAFNCWSREYADFTGNPTTPWRLKEVLRDARRWTDQLELGKSTRFTAAYCLAVYHAYHVTALESKWTLDGISKYRIRADLQLRDAYYWDGTRYHPLSDAPGLQAVAMPETRKDLVAQYGGPNYKGSTVLEDVAMRISVYEQHKDTLKHYSAPKETTPLCNMVLSGVHLLKSCPANDAILTFKLRSKSHQEKMKALVLAHTRLERRERMDKRLFNALEAAATTTKKDVTLVQ